MEASGRLSCKAEVRLQLDNKTLYGKARNFYLDERQGKEREAEREGGRHRESERVGEREREGGAGKTRFLRGILVLLA